MANRPAYFVSSHKDVFLETVNIDFQWFAGFSLKQKQQSIKSLHQKITEQYPDSKVLEISSKSTNELGIALSAFNLMIQDESLHYSVESAFQGSKVFENGGPFTDLLKRSSGEAKKDPRLKSSGAFKHFQYQGRIWPTDPKTLFYDWLYINALAADRNLQSAILHYNVFTDIEFNPKKSINCQAKSAALFVSLQEKNLLKGATSSINNYLKIMGVMK